jgi:hypothetical protein
MQPVLVYLLKMLLCSAVLLGYYWVALRNERFHQWNRFYLLSAFVLSVVIPFFNIPLLRPEEPTAMVAFVGALPWNQAMVAKPAAFSWGWKETGMMVAALVSLLLLLHLLISVVRIVLMYKRNTPTYFNEVSVVITEERSAPFSFFRWLFWRSDIDPDTENGQRMLQHELTHISERHSADKLFVELLLIVGWMNPFFWLMRRELYAIHEFLADQKAIARHDGAAFAAMILQATQTTPYALSNPFFSSHLKRRLQMITNSHNPKYSYLRRISGLVLMMATAALLVVSIDNAYAQDKKKKTPPPAPAAPTAPAAPVAPPDGQWKELPDSIKSAEVIDRKGVCYIQYNMKDGRKLVYELNEAKKKGYFIPPPPPPVPAAPDAPTPPARTNEADATAPAAPVSPAKAISITADPQSHPLFYFDGIRISEEHMNMIDPSTIAAVNVWKGEKAIERFGNDARYGAVEIISKANAEVPTFVTPPATTQSLKSKATLSTLLQSASNGTTRPLIILNDKEITDEEMKSLDPKSIMEIRVIKGADAFKQYGAKGLNGVIVIKEGC